MRKLIAFCFMLFAFTAMAQTPDTLTPEKNARWKIGRIRDNTVRAITPQDFRNAFNALANLAVNRMPVLNQSQVRAGYGDTSRVIQVLNPINKQAFPYYYDASSTDNDDSATVLRYGTRVYKIRTDFITPEIFGAVGDGITNDSLAFARAMRYLHNKTGGGTLTIPAKTYLRADMIVTKKDIHVVGRGTLKNATIYIHGPVPKTTMNFRVEGITFERTTMVKGEFLTVNNGIEIYNASAGAIVACKFFNVNAGLYVVPTGKFQHTQRIDIDNCYFREVNYGIKVPDVPDFIDGVAVTSRINVGDMTFTTSTIEDAYYDHFYGFGLDGLTTSGITTYSRWNGDLTTKRHNFNIKRSTRIEMSDMKLFEAGDDAIRLTDCDKVNIENSQIAWPGQRVVASGIHSIRNVTYPEITKSLTVANVLIETPTLHGILLEGTVPTRMYTFTGIHLQHLGRSDKFYGASLGNPAPGTFAHYSIKSDSFQDGVTYIGKTDSEFTDFSPLIEGRAGYWQEENTFFNTINRGYGQGISFGFAERQDMPPIRENLLSRSNGLNTSSYTVSNSTITPIDNAYTPFGVGRVFKLAETAATGSLEHVIFLTTPVTKDSVGDVAYTLTFYAKAAERRYISVYLINSSFAPGLPIDFDLVRGVPASTGDKALLGAGYKVLNSSIERANNGFYKISISYISPAAHTTTRFAIYLKNLIQNQGPRSYVGTDGSGVILSDFNYSRTSVELKYTPTNGASYVRSMDLPNTTETQTKTASGTGSATTINISHGLSYTPVITSVNPNNLASIGAVVTADATNFILTYSVAPANGTNNLSYNISYKR